MKSRYSITHGNSKHYLFEILNNVTGDWLSNKTWCSHSELGERHCRVLECHR